ncbi:hypothetical protein Ciccas_003357 [Cichlidogyrus casuarinus]|uniref:C2H2-type domain-containing protein n=1 Tax=Cichlidogyrus casuarinus TaxID=1844966 RepID=A0ABD2QEL7_9PLAT
MGPNPPYIPPYNQQMPYNNGVPPLNKTLLPNPPAYPMFNSPLQPPSYGVDYPPCRPFGPPPPRGIKRPFGQINRPMVPNKVYPCDTCKVKCSTYTSYQMHMQSPGHLKKVERAKSGFKPNEIKCDLCMISVTSEEHLQIHMAGAKHRKNATAAAALAATSQAQMGGEGVAERSAKTGESNVDVQMPSITFRRPIVGHYSCEVCNVFCDTEVQMNVHLGGKKHKMNIRLKESGGPPPPYFLPVDSCYGEDFDQQVFDSIALELSTLEKDLMDLKSKGKSLKRGAQWSSVLRQLYIPPEPKPPKPVEAEASQKVEDGDGPKAEDEGERVKVEDEGEGNKAEEEEKEATDEDAKVKQEEEQEEKEEQTKEVDEREKPFCEHAKCSQLRALKMYQAWLLFQREQMQIAGSKRLKHLSHELGNAKRKAL